MIKRIVGQEIIGFGPALAVKKSNYKVEKEQMSMGETIMWFCIGSLLGLLLLYVWDHTDEFNDWLVKSLVTIFS